MNWNRVGCLLKETYAEWSEDKAAQMAAALAFYAAFALAPLIIIVIEIGALVLGGNGHHQSVREALLRWLEPAIGLTGTKTIDDLVQATFQERRHGVLAMLVGWVVFVLAASGFFVAIGGMLDSIWRVQSPNAGFASIVRERARSIAIIAGVSLVFAVTLVANAAIATVVRSGMLTAPGWNYVVRIVTASLSLLLASVAFAALYKYLPRASIAWKDVAVGAVLTAVLCGVGQYLIGLYIGRISTTSTYGTAGSFVAILLWLYYSCQIFLFGAEFTKVFARRAPSTRSG